MVEIMYDQGYPPKLLDELRHVPMSTSVPFVDCIRTSEVNVCHTLADRIRTWPRLAPLHNQLGHGAIATMPLAIDGKTIGALGLGFPETRELVAEDIKFAVTLAHLAAQALQRSRLYEAEQTAVRQRDEFLTVAAHELKTPMTSLRGFAQLELLRHQGDESTSPDPTRHSLEIIDLQAAKMSNMIARLFDVAQIDTGKLVLHRRLVNLTAVIEAIVATFPSGGHPILVDAVPMTPAVIDPLRIEQIVTNLLDNAVKYTPEETAIEVQVSRPSDDIVRLAVRDHGMGIPPARRGHIFERYYRADDENHRSGIGLGLYICYQIVELHGGWIWAEFPEDGGTRIVVTLPTGRADRRATTEIDA
jgi:signal transduction histidine kinase